MSYIYDILLNYNKELYDFYEWNLDDDICHIRKTPLFKVTTNQLVDIANNDIKIEYKFIQSIANKTEIFTKNDVKVMNYVCLFSDGDKVISVKFNKDGLSLLKSGLLVEEEEEVTDMALRLKPAEFTYVVLKKHNIDNFKTRKEHEIEVFINNKIKEETNIDKLRYLYFDCFGKKENDRNKIISKILDEMNNNWDNIYLKVYNFFKLLSR